jgi:hypothetical protein
VILKITKPDNATPPADRPNAPQPTAVSFGHVHIDGQTRAMTVSHRNLAGETLHQLDLHPKA